MTTPPIPRASSGPDPSPQTEPVSAILHAMGRGSAYGTPDISLVVDLNFHPDRPYEVVMVIADRHYIRADGTARWVVSREVLCNAAIWQTPAGMCDFMAVPMSDRTIQLVIRGSGCQQGESLHVDVARADLLRFLERTLRAVKAGRESKYMDMDSVVDALLANS